LLFLFVAPAVSVPVEEPFATEITAGHDAMDPVFSIFEDSRSNDVPIDDGLSDVQLLHDERLLKSRSTSQELTQLKTELKDLQAVARSVREARDEAEARAKQSMRALSKDMARLRKQIAAAARTKPSEEATEVDLESSASNHAMHSSMVSDEIANSTLRAMLLATLTERETTTEELQPEPVIGLKDSLEIEVSEGASQSKPIVIDAVLEPDISKSYLKEIIKWIRIKVTEARLPFCWRNSYGRGVGKVPGRPAACKRGYYNHGLTCHRPAHSIWSPSRAAICPRGYTHMGLTCFRGMQSYGKGCCCTIWGCCGGCKPGFKDIGCFCHIDAHSVGMDRMRCPHGYFLSKWTGRCHKKCPPGYSNTGETCYRGPHNNAEFSCRPGEILAGTKRCFPGNGDTCEAHEQLNGALCYPKCRSGFHGAGPVCWQDCPSNPVKWAGCGAGCAVNSKECGMTIANQIFAPLVMAASIATLGGVGAGATAAKTAVVTSKTLTVGGKVMKFASKVGKLLTKAVNALKKIGKSVGKVITKAINKFKATKIGSKLNKAYQWGQKTFGLGKHATKLPKDAKLYQRMYHAKAGTNFRKATILAKEAKVAYDAADKYATAYAEDFAKQTSKEISRAIDQRFKPFTAKFIKKTWAMDQLVEMSEANHWGIAQTALAAASVVDPTGVMGVAEAYAKPKCKDLVKLPCPPKVTLKC
jgi:hypothetical protein